MFGANKCGSTHYEDGIMWVCTKRENHVLWDYVHGEIAQHHPTLHSYYVATWSVTKDNINKHQRNAIIQLWRDVVGNTGRSPSGIIDPQEWADKFQDE